MSGELNAILMINTLYVIESVKGKQMFQTNLYYGHSRVIILQFFYFFKVKWGGGGIPTPTEFFGLIPVWFG